MATIDHFSRGRDAYTAGKPMFCQDARITGAARNAWYAGWRHQQNLNTQPAAAAALAESIAGIDAILANLRNSQP